MHVSLWVYTVQIHTIYSVQIIIQVYYFISSSSHGLGFANQLEQSILNAKHFPGGSKYSLQVILKSVVVSSISFGASCQQP